MDTIAAIATASGNAGIGKIRISGDDAVKIADSVFKSPGGKKRLSDAQSHTVNYGYICNEDRVIDEVLVSIFKAPKSYTREDVVEIDCHGGVIALRSILELVLDKGARAAEPGEFTKRAFLNGRIDLTEAEAVMDIISSRNKMAMDNSVKQLRGALYQKIQKLRDSILNDTAYIEAALDDPEHIEMEGFGDALLPRLKEEAEEIRELYLSFNDGRIIREGIKTVIIGKPNAGKSSLLNMLLGTERAIVTEIAGTTRDTLEEYADLNGITLKIIDTAGIRDTADTVEKIGVERAKEAAKDADLVIFVADNSAGFSAEDREVLKAAENKKMITVLNKTDITDGNMDISVLKEAAGEDIIEISAKNYTGLSEIRKRIEELFFAGELSFNEEIYITNERHRKALQDAEESLKRVMESIENGVSEDFYTIDLMDAYSALGSIIGERVEDDIADRVFERFCMGK